MNQTPGNNSTDDADRLQPSIGFTGQGLLERAQFLASIVDTSEDAIISKTLNGIVTSWNKAAENLFGYTAEEMIGQSIMTVIPSDRRDEEAFIQEKIRSGRRIEHYETVRQRKDGSLVSISLSISPILGAEGRVIGASKIARDITEWKRNEAERQELLEREQQALKDAQILYERAQQEILERRQAEDRERAARTDAERAARLRDEFLATVSHELRTPLNGVLGWAQLLRRNPEDAELRSEAVDAIERGARAQARLIDDLLDVSRIISGKLRLDVQTVELAPLVQAAVDTVRPPADAKEIRLDTVLDPSAKSIKGDPARLQQVFWNLLSNAVKFTPKGGRVQVHLERVNSHVEISVSDSGKGIDPEFLPHVFERFSQADSSTTRKHGGLGLGLAVVKHLVELHGGRVAATSKGENLGATFTVTLPVPIIHHDSAGREHPATARDNSLFSDIKLKNVQVLVVDDDNDSCVMLRRVLQECEAQVETATSSEAALHYLRNTVPDVIVSDIGMPDLDGYDLIRTVRERGLTVPAIAVTAFTRAEDRIRAFRAGYNMHVSKPLEPNELIAMISSLVHARS